MIQIKFMLLMGNVLFLKLYLLVLKISPLQEGLTIDVPLFYALYLLIFTHN